MLRPRVPARTTLRVKRPKILLVGAGGIGGVLGSLLSQADVELSVLTTNDRIAQALRQRGFRLRGDAQAAQGGRPPEVLRTLLIRATSIGRCWRCNRRK